MKRNGRPDDPRGPSRGSTRSESEQGGRLDTESRGIGTTEIGQSEARDDAERPRPERRDSGADEERERPAGAGTARGEER